MNTLYTNEREVSIGDPNLTNLPIYVVTVPGAVAPAISPLLPFPKKRGSFRSGRRYGKQDRNRRCLASALSTNGNCYCELLYPTPESGMITLRGGKKRSNHRLSRERGLRGQ